MFAAFFDGRTAAELRLWDALERRPALPVPLLRRRRRHRPSRHRRGSGAGTTRQALSNVYTGNDARAADRASSSCETRCSTSVRMRALGFCVSVAHAEYMAQRLQRGRHSRRSRSAATTSQAERAASPRRPASTPGQRIVRGRPLQRGTRPARRRHGSVPPADRERHDLPSAARTRAPPPRGQSSPHGPRLRWAPPQGVPLRRDAPSTHRCRPAGGSSARSNAVSRSCPRAARSSWTSRPRRVVLENIKAQIANRWSADRG